MNTKATLSFVSPSFRLEHTPEAPDDNEIRRETEGPREASTEGTSLLFRCSTAARENTGGLEPGRTQSLRTLVQRRPGPHLSPTWFPPVPGSG